MKIQESKVYSAPSNIALIKYMGKIDTPRNRPTNASLSWTLEHLRSYVRLTPTEGPDRWQALAEAVDEKRIWPLQLSEKGQEKFIHFFRRLKDWWKIEQNYLIESANNFPSDCGLASSASSFAALTIAGAQTFQRPETNEELSMLSRKGSGSSCRSFFTPWGLWAGDGAIQADLPEMKLHHAAVLVEAGIKSVSSSEAHQRVLTSPRFAGRPERAEQRLRELLSALKENNWKSSYEIARDEYVDMHELFETSVPPFKYRIKESQNVTDACQHIWNHQKDGPIVTMDAGANVHLLYRQDQLELAEKMIKHFREKHRTITSWDGLR